MRRDPVMTRSTGAGHGSQHRRCDPVTRCRRDRSVRWLAERDGIGHAHVGRGRVLATACGRPPVLERHAWPTRSRCTACVAAVDAQLSLAASRRAVLLGTRPAQRSTPRIPLAATHTPRPPLVESESPPEPAADSRVRGIHPTPTGGQE